MLERALLPHRIYAGKGSTRLYSLYEDYVRTLQSFGVKTLTAERLYRPEAPAAKPAKYQAEAVAVPRGSAQPNHGLVITETAAQALVETADGAVHIPCRAIVTPAAADVFKKAQVAVEKDL